MRKGTIVSDREILMRKHPRKGTDIVGFVNPFDEVEVGKIAGTWIEITNSKGHTGYIEHHYLAS